MNRLHHAAPASGDFLRRAAERGLNLGNITGRLLVLLDEYGAHELDSALVEINVREIMHVPAVRMLLEQRRHAEGRPPRVAVTLPDDPRLRDIVVRPHDLKTYDNIHEGNDDDQDSNP